MTKIYEIIDVIENLDTKDANKYVELFIKSASVANSEIGFDGIREDTINVDEFLRDIKKKDPRITIVR